MNNKIKNPFGKEISTETQATNLAEQRRQEAEIQSAMVIAKRFPRNQVEAMDRILNACARPTLAEGALYAYPRGGTLVTGPSIRLAEAIAQCWGNMQFGIRELSQGSGESTVEAFAWDLETNTRQIKTFQVRHIRHTSQGDKKLEDPRDIYEMVANQGARRLRACILGIVPGDIIDAAQKQCELTQEQAYGATEDQIGKLTAAFDAIGVTPSQIEKYIGHRLDSIVAAEIVRLRKIYASIRDGMSSASDFFDAEISDAAKDLQKKAAKPADRFYREPEQKETKEQTSVAPTKPQSEGTDAPPPGEDEDEGDEWPKVIDGVLVDKRRVPWHADFYSARKTCTDAGHWRKRRGAMIDKMNAYEARYIAKKESGSKETKPAEKTKAPPLNLDGNPPPVIDYESMKARIKSATGAVELSDLIAELNAGTIPAEQLRELVDLAEQYRADWLLAEEQAREAEGTQA